MLALNHPGEQITQTFSLTDLEMDTDPSKTNSSRCYCTKHYIHRILKRHHRDRVHIADESTGIKKRRRRGGSLGGGAFFLAMEEECRIWFSLGKCP